MARFFLAPLLLAIILAGITGCAQPRIFYRPGSVSFQQYDQDLRQCQYVGELGRPYIIRPFGIPHHDDIGRVHQLTLACMRARGYDWLTVAEVEARGQEWGALCGATSKCRTQWP